MVNGKKQGDVFYYNEAGKMVSRKTYSEDVLINDSCFWQEETGGANRCKYQEYPQFTGGNDGWKKYLDKNLQYPEFAQENGIMGVVKAVFTVDENGNISNISIISSPHRSLSEETIRIIKASPAWTPAIIYNRPISMDGTQSITFKLQ